VGLRTLDGSHSGVLPGAAVLSEALEARGGLHGRGRVVRERVPDEGGHESETADEGGHQVRQLMREAIR
jgi:hypothetical protein